MARAPGTPAPTEGGRYIDEGGRYIDGGGRYVRWLHRNRACTLCNVYPMLAMIPLKN